MASANEFPLDPVDGALAELEKANGSTVVYKYDKANAAWNIVGVNGGTSEFVTTSDVQTTADEPAKPTGFTSFDSMQDLGYLTNQKLVNWFLAEKVLTNAEDVSEILWIGEDPPVDKEYLFWFDASRLELLVYYNDQWFPVSIPPSQMEDLRLVIQQELGNVFDDIERVEREAGIARRNLKESIDLEQVLTNGAVADQGIILRSPDALESDADAIILAPTISRITLAAEEKENFLPTFQLIERGENSSQTRTAEFELDEGRLDINMTEQQDEVHFRFRDEEELILRHRSNPAGPSELFGRLKVDPGTEGNEVVTYGQLQTVEEELEQLAPSLERGIWLYTPDPNPLPGRYTLIKEMLTKEQQEQRCQDAYSQCLIDAGSDPSASSECNRTLAECQAAVVDEGVIITTDQFAEADQILFSEYDINGVLHEFKGIDDDHVMDMFNEDDESFGVFDILEHGGGLFNVDTLKSRGTATGAAKLKIFKHEGSVDFEQYATHIDVENEFKASGRLRYEYMGIHEPEDLPGGGLQPGQMCRSNDDDKVYFHYLTKDRFNIMQEPDQSDYWDNPFFIRIWRTDNQSQALLMHCKQIRYWTHDVKQHIEFSGGKIIGKSNLRLETDFYVNLGGFF